MRSILVREFGGPEVLRLEEGPELTPAPGQVLVRVRAAGVNPVDAYVRTGTYAQKPALPYVPGSDGAGEIEAVGSEVSGLARGERIYIANDNTQAPRTGTYADYALCAPGQIHRLPMTASFSQGAALGVPYATAYRALFMRANARPAETVLVHGASGGVGVAAVQFARAHGMRIIATAGTDRGMQLARDNGADVVLNHTDPSYVAAIMKAADGRGADVILEMAAHINLDRDLTMQIGRAHV